MARRHRPVRSSPGKGGFLRGLVLGLAVAAGVQVYHTGLPEWLHGSDDADTSAGASGRFEPPKTNFDFYRLLPRTEVRIDDPAPPGGAPRPAGRTAPRPSTAAGGRSPREPATPVAREYRVQVGSFRERRQADRLRASLALGGFESGIQTRDTAEGTWHRVMLGPFRGREAAEAARARVATVQGIDARIVPGES